MQFDESSKMKKETQQTSVACFSRMLDGSRPCYISRYNPPKPLCGIELYDVCGSAASIWKSIVFPTVSKECNA